MEEKVKVRLKQRLIELIEHLYNENIIEINVVDFEKGSFYDTVVFLRDTLKKEYPKTKIKRIMKSIHYANSFNDEPLKQSAFLLDEIEQYLCFNKFLNHDKSVEYFNEKITADGVVINLENLLEVMIESLLDSEKI
ncbi:hypothetical protein [Gemella morbillorum]|uniref:hypothetical protein n=1 Tax=Gemella morbillorum TaxID=29391 RepID=UPI0028CFE1F5|nr:hypothetical protein [Gemella morbillorum]